MMTSTQIRQSFLDFFKSKQHTIVPSSSLMPDSPNLLFTNAGMNQFVPIFLGQVKCPYSPGRAADTQKCIRAGGKHNDLDDVGLDTYHHTFFEMLGNWSFGDYFKKDAINWAWELIIEVWKFPPSRLYATIYQPDKSKNDPADRDQEAWELWAAKFRSVGLDPDVHIVNGNKKDNFWMMGETGPCGPCTEMHVDLRPGPVATDLDAQISGAKLVNGSDARCIEIWNNVFIQYNAEPATPEDASKMKETGAIAGVTWKQKFVELPAQHVDTGMGFERVTSIIQGTKNLTDFQNAKISNYETDIFRPIFDAIEKLSGKKYGSTLPKPGSTGDTEQEKIDVSFRVIADHIRTLSFAIADGIEPGAKERNGVLRSIHKRMVRYASNIGVENDLLLQTQDSLVETLAATMGDVFPELRAKKEHIKKVLRGESEVFNKTLADGLDLFESAIKEIGTIENYLDTVPARLTKVSEDLRNISVPGEADVVASTFYHEIKSPEFTGAAFDSLIEGALTNSKKTIAAKLVTTEWAQKWNLLWSPVRQLFSDLAQLHNYPSGEKECIGKILSAFKQLANELPSIKSQAKIFPGRVAFTLHDTYGFPLDLTQLMARERGLTVDKEGFDVLMDKQRKQSQAAQKKEVISISQSIPGQATTVHPTKFVGYEQLTLRTRVQHAYEDKGKSFVILDSTPLYAEMGGQVGDIGTMVADKRSWQITNTLVRDKVFHHALAGTEKPEIGADVELTVNPARRNAIQRHHTVTHLLHWALHEVASQEASQKGSFVGPDKLTFDFNSAPLTPAQVADIEKLVNERILENAPVSWTEVPHADVKNRKDVMQFFGDKYGDTVRVVQVGGAAGKLDGYSMELCGGTHTRATGEIGLFRIVGENAIAAGVRRIEAVAGLEAYNVANEQLRLLRTVAGKINSPVGELEKKIEALLAQQKDLEKSLRTAVQRNASNAASELLIHAQTVNGIPIIAHNLGDAEGDFLQAIADALKGRFPGVIVLGGGADDKVTLIACVSPEYTAKVQAGKIIQAIAPIVGGKGGGKPDQARGGGKDASKVDEALAKAKTLLG